MITVSSREDFLKEVNKLLTLNSICCELGVLNGDFSQMMLDILNPNILLLVDPFEINEKKYKDGITTAYSTDAEYKNVLKKFIQNERVIINKNYSYNAVRYYVNNYFDLIYIDASHLYEDVKKDLNDWLPKLKSGGIMSGHDYTDAYGFGVIRAVDEFCIEHNFEMILLNNKGFDWALKKKK